MEPKASLGESKTHVAPGLTLDDGDKTQVESTEGILYDRDGGGRREPAQRLACGAHLVFPPPLSSFLFSFILHFPCVSRQDLAN